MSFRQSSGRDICNRCRKAIDLGAPVFVGPITGACWCEACAAEVVGQSPSGAVPRRITPSDGEMTAFDPKAMGADLRARILTRRRGVSALSRDVRQLQSGED